MKTRRQQIRRLYWGVAVIIGQTADNLKAFLCESNWWDHSFTISKKCPLYILHSTLIWCSGADDSVVGNPTVYHGPESPVRIQRVAVHLHDHL